MIPAEQIANTSLERGTVVKSKAGHDAGSFYVVLKAESDFVWIADGRRRKSEKPKRKNIRHIAKTNRIVPEEDLLTDKKIRRVLWELNFGSDSPVAC
ncbi:Uncharacterised protein [uncultured Ruminococcus sp.]|uniref:KOW domain-containing RNA-binding protein n=1 Tax=Massiliimalia timonensis TaxID=1987501 RepID=A0A8J6TQ37_9FIRM|nr:KOW domain-containing RNA-binding protein [Massiliimalia timonensis]MBC8610809.1 KOW domain-containing RNA-binding protein [Massiliimalia timonensis]MBS7175911.1 KOW domain-containing RNA-binding protein [Clostridiales bacterium]SCH99571.1 Uncharacterised protein [uncultured Clostridium sp.]SCI19031.1 Uncharacterised protein [uncultured Ruminococcus sp.]